jgi:hypothetical protein
VWGRGVRVGAVCRRWCQQCAITCPSACRHCVSVARRVRALQPQGRQFLCPAWRLGYDDRQALRSEVRDALGVAASTPITFIAGKPAARAGSALRTLIASDWVIDSCGVGSKGERRYAWAWIATASPRHHLRIRRSQVPQRQGVREVAFYLCFVPRTPGHPPRADQDRGTPPARGGGFPDRQGRLWPRPLPGQNLSGAATPPDAVHGRPGRLRHHRPPTPAPPTASARKSDCPALIQLPRETDERRARLLPRCGISRPRLVKNASALGGECQRPSGKVGLYRPEARSVTRSWHNTRLSKVMAPMDVSLISAGPDEPDRLLRKRSDLCGLFRLQAST